MAEWKWKKIHAGTDPGIKVKRGQDGKGGDNVRLDQGSAGSSALFLTGVSAVSQVLGFGYRVILSRMVGAEVMGLYQLVMPVYSVLMSITAVGLTAAASNLSSRYLAMGNSRAVAQTMKSCVKLFLVIMIPVCAVTVLLYDPISVYLLGDARTQLGLVLLLPCVALTGIENVHKHFFYGSSRVRPPAVVELLEQFIRAGAVLGLLVLFLPQNPERTVGLIVTGMIICEIFSSVTLVLLYRRQMARLRITGEGERRGRLYRKMAAIALPVGGTALLGNLMGAVNAALIPQRLVAGGMEPGEAMSAFGILCGMTMPMLSLPTIFLGPLTLVMVPRIARSCALGRMDQVRGGVRRCIELVALVILPCMALITVVGPDLGRLLFGETQAGTYMIPLAFATACGCFQSVLSGTLNATDRQGTAAGIALFCDVVQLALTVLLMGRPGGGMDGFVAGVVVSSILGLLLCGGTVCRTIKLSFPVWQEIALPGLAALLSWQTSLLLFRWLQGTEASEGLRVCTVLVFGGLIYLCALCAMGVDVGKFSRRKQKLR